MKERGAYHKLIQATSLNMRDS